LEKKRARGRGGVGPPSPEGRGGGGGDGLQVVAKCKLHFCHPNYEGLKTLPHHEIFQNGGGGGNLNVTGGGVFT
jgi:hypothetical protein